MSGLYLKYIVNTDIRYTDAILTIGLGNNQDPTLGVKIKFNYCIIFSLKNRGLSKDTFLYKI